MIPLFYTAASSEDKNLVLDVLDSGQFVMGKRVEEFEASLNEYFGFGGCVTCASGTDAIVMALEELGCNYGVIVPAMTFSATYEAVLRAGLTPIVCDVDEQTLTPSLNQIRDAMVASITRGQAISAIIIVNLYGWPAYELAEIADFCRAQNIFLIEDCAQSFGAKLDGRLVGTFGDAAAFSFYPTKPLGGIGDGGAVWFADKVCAETAAARRNHGRVKNNVQVCAGYNSRLDEANAAVLTRRLRDHWRNMEARRVISGQYHVNGLKKLSIRRQGTGVPYVYPIFVDNREHVMFKLASIGVGSRVHYDPPVSELPYVMAACPNAKWAASRILSLPCHQGMTTTDVNRISDVIREAGIAH